MATANTFVQIGATVTVGSGGTATITFSSIPATYTDLKLVMSTRNLATSGGRDYTSIRFNGDSGANYSRKWVYNVDGTAGSGTGTGESALAVIVQNDSQSTANVFNNSEVYIPNYASANYKSASIDSVSENNSSATYAVELSASLWSSTSAITSMVLYPAAGGGAGTFVEYSTASLYGMLKY